MRNQVKLILSGLLFLTAASADGQKVIFLHHSIGKNLYFNGNVASWINNYNQSNGKSFHVVERSYPNTPWPWNNYPYDYWKLWVNGSCNSADTSIECLNTLAANYDMVIFKHCAPGSSIYPDNGEPDVTSSYQTIANYKLQYRALRSLFDSYPNTKFMVWTLPPWHRLSTSPEVALRAYEFVQWVKNEWLTEDGKTHSNIFIFDFFSLVAEMNENPENGHRYCLKYEYEGSHTDADSHPNLAANQLIGPVFAQAIVNAFAENVVQVTGITVTGAGGETTITSHGGTLQLSADVLPADATNKTVNWSIQNGTGQASISITGLVTAIANGTATATATAADGSGVTGSLSITISGQTVAVTGIAVTGADGASTITALGGTLQLSVTVSPDNATNKTVTWTVQNGTGQASISAGGLVTAVANGTATATATAADGSGINGNLVITIAAEEVAVTSIVVYGTDFQTSITTPGGTLQMNTTILPDNATNKTVSWSVDKVTGQATISSDGLLSAKADGQVTVKAVATDGSGKSGILIISLENQGLPTGTENNGIEPALITFSQSVMIIRLNDNEIYKNIKLFNLLGNLVLNQKLSGNICSVDISFLLPGVFIIMLTEENKVNTFKVSIP